MISSKNINDISLYNNYLLAIKDFYKDLNNISFRDINFKKLIELKQMAKPLNNFYNYEEETSRKCTKYTRTMDKIKTQPKLSKAERYLLFMFSIDPDFEAFKIYGECNKRDEIKTKMIYKFGIFDQYLIFIEKFFIKNFLSEKKRKEIDEEIERRVFK